MHVYQSVLFVAFIAGIFIMILCAGLKHIVLKTIIIVSALLCMLRFVVLLFFSSAVSLENVHMLGYPAMAAITIIPATSFLCIRYLNKRRVLGYDLVFAGAISAITAWLLYESISGIIIREFGYGIMFKVGGQLIVSIAYCIFCAILIYFATLYFLQTKAVAEKMNYFIYIIGFCAALAEYAASGLGYGLFQENIISELILMIAIMMSVRLFAENK